MDILLTHVTYAPCVYLIPMKAKRGHRVPGPELQTVLICHVVLRIEPNIMQENSVLKSTGPSLQLSTLPKKLFLGKMTQGLKMLAMQA